MLHDRLLSTISPENLASSTCSTSGMAGTSSFLIAKVTFERKTHHLVEVNIEVINKPMEDHWTELNKIIFKPAAVLKKYSDGRKL